MTLATRAHIPKPVAAERLFLRLLDVLQTFPSFTPSWEKEGSEDPFKATPGPLRHGRATYKHVRKGDVSWVTKDGEERFEDESEFRSTLGQGLPALLTVTYGSDGPLRWPHAEGEPCDCTDYGNTADPYEEHFVAVDFDTTYGWKAPNGAGCSDLHAYLLVEVGRWLLNEGVDDWSWHQEFRGTWHGPLEVHEVGDPALGEASFRG